MSAALVAALIGTSAPAYALRTTNAGQEESQVRQALQAGLEEPRRESRVAHWALIGLLGAALSPAQDLPPSADAPPPLPMIRALDYPAAAPPLELPNRQSLPAILAAVRAAPASAGHLIWWLDEHTPQARTRWDTALSDLVHAFPGRRVVVVGEQGIPSLDVMWQALPQYAALAVLPGAVDEDAKWNAARPMFETYLTRVLWPYPEKTVTAFRRAIQGGADPAAIPTDRPDWVTIAKYPGIEFTSERPPLSSWRSLLRSDMAALRARHALYLEADAGAFHTALGEWRKSFYQAHRERDETLARRVQEVMRDHPEAIVVVPRGAFHGWITLAVRDQRTPGFQTHVYQSVAFEAPTFRAFHWSAERGVDPEAPWPPALARAAALHFPLQALASGLGRQGLPETEVYQRSDAILAPLSSGAVAQLTKDLQTHGALFEQQGGDTVLGIWLDRVGRYTTAWLREHHHDLPADLGLRWPATWHDATTSAALSALEAGLEERPILTRALRFGLASWLGIAALAQPAPQPAPPTSVPATQERIEVDLAAWEAAERRLWTLHETAAGRNILLQTRQEAGLEPDGLGALFEALAQYGPGMDEVIRGPRSSFLPALIGKQLVLWHAVTRLPPVLRDPLLREAGGAEFTPERFIRFWYFALPSVLATHGFFVWSTVILQAPPGFPAQMVAMPVADIYPVLAAERGRTATVWGREMTYDRIFVGPPRVTLAGANRDLRAAYQRNVVYWPEKREGLIRIAAAFQRGRAGAAADRRGARAVPEAVFRRLLTGESPWRIAAETANHWAFEWTRERPLKDIQDELMRVNELHEAGHLREQRMEDRTAALPALPPTGDVANVLPPLLEQYVRGSEQRAERVPLREGPHALALVHTLELAAGLPSSPTYEAAFQAELNRWVVELAKDPTRYGFTIIPSTDPRASPANQIRAQLGNLAAPHYEPLLRTLVATPEGPAAVLPAVTVPVERSKFFWPSVGTGIALVLGGVGYYGLRWRQQRMAWTEFTTRFSGQLRSLLSHDRGRGLFNALALDEWQSPHVQDLVLKARHAALQTLTDRLVADADRATDKPTQQLGVQQAIAASLRFLLREAGHSATQVALSAQLERLNQRYPSPAAPPKGGLEELAPAALIMLGTTLLFGGLAARRFRRSQTQQPNIAQGGLEEGLVPAPTAEVLLQWIAALPMSPAPSQRLYGGLASLPTEEQHAVAQTVARAYRVFNEHFRWTAEYMVQERERARSTISAKPEDGRLYRVSHVDVHIQDQRNAVARAEFPTMAVLGEEGSVVVPDAKWRMVSDSLEGTEDYDGTTGRYLSIMTMLYEASDGHPYPILTIAVAPEYPFRGRSSTWLVAGLGIHGVLVNGQPTMTAADRALKDLVGDVSHLRGNEPLNAWYVPALREHARGIVESHDSKAMFQIPLSLSDSALPGLLLIRPLRPWDGLSGWHLVEALGGAVMTLDGQRYHPTREILVPEDVFRDPQHLKRLPPLLYSVSARAAQEILAHQPKAGLEETARVAQDQSAVILVGEGLARVAPQVAEWVAIVRTASGLEEAQMIAAQLQRQGITTVRLVTAENFSVEMDRALQAAGLEQSARDHILDSLRTAAFT